MSLSKTTSDGFYQALDTIIENRLSNAGYNSTIHGIIDSVVSEGQGLYNVKYQDTILRNVRSNNPSVSYSVGQRVIVVLPHGDVNNSNKYISNSIDMKVNSFQNVQNLGVTTYNLLGKNVISLNSSDKGNSEEDEIALSNNIFQISSYQCGEYTVRDQEGNAIKEQIGQFVIYNKDKEDSNFITIDNEKLINNVKKGNGVVIGCTLQTALDFAQMGGQYGIEVDVDIYQEVTRVAATHTYVVGSRQIDGNPYQVTSPTQVKIFLDDLEINAFNGISEIRLYCKDFIVKDYKNFTKDIFISNLCIYGGQSIGQKKESSDVIVAIDMSSKINEEGNQLSQEQKLIKLKAQLLVKGKKVTEGVKYLWFKEDGRVFNSTQNSGGVYFHPWAGAGWNCVNSRSVNNTAHKNTTPIFYFTTADKDHVSFSEYAEFFKEYDIEKVANFEKLNACVKLADQKVKCIAVYDGNSYTSGQIRLFNTNLRNNVEIISSDRINGENQTIYFLNNGSPTLTCITKDEKGDEMSSAGLQYTWSIKNNNGKFQRITQVDFKKQYCKAYWDFMGHSGQTKFFPPFLKKVSKDDPNGITNPNTEDGIEYKVSHRDQKTANSIRTTSQEYKDIKAVYDEYFTSGNPLCTKAAYQNFPISSITGSATISCSVSDSDGVYLGADSITLENKIQLSDRYSLEITNATQVFKYDNKGNSPISPQFQNSKNQIEIKPLSFILLDKGGNKVSLNRIRQNGGFVKWLFPKQNTLLISKQEDGVNGQDDQVISNADLPLSADSYIIYNNLQTFSFSIGDKFNNQSVNNDIVLYVVLNKNTILTDITNFTFPKQGDSGTNGTDYFAIIKTTNSSDRLYVNNFGNTFDDNDDDSNSAATLQSILYNNGQQVNGATGDFSILGGQNLLSLTSATHRISNEWQLPSEDIINNIDSTKSYSWKTDTASAFRKFINNNKITNIVRVIYTIGDIKNYVEKPICYNVIKSSENNLALYRIKLKAKTGFQYVVYSDDGTRPEYNDKPFEIEVQTLVENCTTAQYRTDATANLTYRWRSTGNVHMKDTNQKNSNKITYVPNDTFDGENLCSGIYCQVYKGTVQVPDNLIGILYAPIYMCLNRYGHQALNQWDGNSIQLDADGNTTILAPQMGAGKKQSKTFTGIVMGVEHTNSTSTSVPSTDRTGLFGYHKGQRTIFLNAESGSAEFGINNAGKITIDPNTKIIYRRSDDALTSTYSRPAALLYSQGIRLYDEDENGKQIASPSSVTQPARPGYIDDYIRPSTTRTHNYGSGMIIDLTSPAIAFGSGKFYVEPNGEMTAAAGNIGGWVIGKEYLRSKDGKVYLRSSDSTKASFDTINSNNLFKVTNNGQILAQAGTIANWKLTDKTLTDGTVGLGTSAVHVGSKAVSSAKFWGSASSQAAGQANFAISNAGNLYAQGGNIAGWDLSANALTNGNVGLGTTSIDGVDASIWSVKNDDKFYVKNTGEVVANSGSIGGWKLGKTSLSSSNSKGSITINANGTISGQEAKDNGFKWEISNSGTASFNNILATGGSIGGWTINKNSLTADKVSIDKDGDIQCKQGNTIHWGIYHNGDACFNNIYGKIKDGSSLSGGGMTVGSSNGYTDSNGNWHPPVQSNIDPGDVTTNGTSQKLTEFIDVRAETVITNNLFVGDIFNYQSNSVSWRKIPLITGLYFERRDPNNANIITDIAYTRDQLWVLGRTGTGYDYESGSGSYIHAQEVHFT